MTEAGELWIDEVVYKDEKNWPTAEERKAVGLGLRAFVAFVHKRAAQSDPPDYNEAFLSLVRVLLGEPR